jgi:transposase
VAATLIVIDRHEQLKGHYIVMDNAPIHTHVDIQKLIEQRGYGCIYLPPYSPELNPIEQFWSACKSKLKKRKAFEERNIDNENW